MNSTQCSVLHVKRIVSVVINGLHPKTGAWEMVLRRCWTLAPSTCHTDTSYKQFPPTHCFVHRIDVKSPVFSYCTQIPWQISSCYSLGLYLRTQRACKKGFIIVGLTCTFPLCSPAGGKVLLYSQVTVDKLSPARVSFYREQAHFCNTSFYLLNE